MFYPRAAVLHCFQGVCACEVEVVQRAACHKVDTTASHSVALSSLWDAASMLPSGLHATLKSAACAVARSTCTTRSNAAMRESHLLSVMSGGIVDLGTCLNSLFVLEMS